MVFHSGGVSSGPLLSKNDSYVDIVSGSSQSVFFLGFGNTSKTELIQDAKKELYLNRPLQKGEYYSNFTTDISSLYFLLLLKRIRVTVSAEVLKADDTISDVFKISFDKKIHFDKNKILIEKKQNDTTLLCNGNLLQNGDSVYCTTDNLKYTLYVAKMVDKETAMLVSTNVKVKSQLVSLRLNCFYIKNRTLEGYKFGDKIKAKFYNLDSYSPVLDTGVILGFCNDRILVRTKIGYDIITKDKIIK